MPQGIELIGRTSRYVSIRHCARCGNDHDNLLFVKFVNPIEDSDGTVWAWWAECPETKDPVLMKDKLKRS